MTTAEPTVVVEIEDRIGWVTLNRPAAMNAITLELAHALDNALVSLVTGADVIVIRGAGGNFCTGGDFDEVERLRAIGPEALAELFEAFGRACDRISRLPVPVVAAVRGYALAGGFELMQASDIVVVCDDARIGDHHARHGMVPGGGSTQRLPRLVGPQRALALLLTGDRLSPTEAVHWGLAYKVLPQATFDDDVRRLASELAHGSRTATQRIKALVRCGLERPLADGLALERQVVVEHLTSDAANDGVAAFTQRSRSRP